jgi:glycosyltransferase involved in cell wall biosynthesis
MKNAKALCLNMIVKNEMANLERCLGAVADHVACWVIGDTGSSDGTQDFIRAFFAARGLPGELHSFPFINFEQARNEALRRACSSPLVYDYLLLTDADMELVVEDRDFLARLEAPCYDLLQRSGVSYWNARLVRRDAGARYHGVTHEYLSVPGGGRQLHGVWYKDHATGANRVDKFERDIRLLLEGLEREPENHRYWFYLAQSYKDAGRTQKAMETYARRASMGGWDEEAWHARLQEARCMLKLKDERGFLQAALTAFNHRPHRAEPLYDLARFYRERGMNDASVLFAEAGLALKRPDRDTLFVEDFVYQVGLKEEYSIAANYSRDPARKDRGHAACDWLALSRDVPYAQRMLARFNLIFYLESADALLTSFKSQPVNFTLPDEWKTINPSITRHREQIVMVQHCIVDEGDYQIASGSPTTTRNFLLRLNAALQVQESTEILWPEDLAPPAFDQVLAFEQLRLFSWRGELWCSSTLRQLTAGGSCDQVLARIDCPPAGPCRLKDWRVLPAQGPLSENNWMPQTAGNDLRFLCSYDPTKVIDDQGCTLSETTPVIAADQFCGGTPAIEFNGGWLALVHEVTVHQDQRRCYQHRFVLFDAASVLRRVSRRFYFRTKGVESAAGVAWHLDRKHLVISYGVQDNESWIATVLAEEVRSLLRT